MLPNRLVGISAVDPLPRDGFQAGALLLVDECDRDVSHAFAPPLILAWLLWRIPVTSQETAVSPPWMPPPRVQRVVVGLDSGFDAYDSINPTLLGDTTGNGTLSSLDAFRIQQQVMGLPVNSFSDIPQV